MNLSMRFLGLAGAGCFLYVAVAVAQPTYICPSEHGKVVYTTVKIHTRCQVSQMDATATASEPVSASEPSITSAIDDEISRVWQRHEFGSFDDTVILPPAPLPDAANRHKPMLQTNTRFNRVQAAKIVNVPTKPVLTRRQTLQQEIDKEQRALVAARMRLATAQKQGNASAIVSIQAQIRDREGNIAALQQEMRR